MPTNRWALALVDVTEVKFQSGHLWNQQNDDTIKTLDAIYNVHVFDATALIMQASIASLWRNRCALWYHLISEVEGTGKRPMIGQATCLNSTPVEFIVYGGEYDRHNPWISISHVDHSWWPTEQKVKEFCDFTSEGMVMHLLHDDNWSGVSHSSRYLHE